MSLFRRPSRPVWENYASVEAFSFALCRAGTPTEEARELLRCARPYFNKLRNAQEMAERRQEALNYHRETHRDATSAAAAKLRREAGYPQEEDPYDLYNTPGAGCYYAGPFEWTGIR